MASLARQPRPKPRETADSSTVQVHITRRTLVLLAVFLTVPWLIAVLLFAGTKLYRGMPQHSPAAFQMAASERVTRGQPGPWGELEYTRIAVEPPDEFVFVPPPDSEPIRWFFKDYSKDRVIDLLKSAELTPAQLDALLKAAWQTTEAGTWVTPDEDLILGISPRARYKIYSLLASFPENSPHIDPFCYRPELLNERLERSSLSESSLGLFKSLLYQNSSSLLMFADIETALRRLPNEAERRRFVKTVSRKVTLLARLRVNPDSNVDDLADYWGIGGRRKDLRPLLDSLTRVEGGCTIDIVHLLPRFVREHLYTYPFTSNDSVVTRQDCFWTAFNFFSDKPDDRFTDMAYARKVIDADYYNILKPTQLGDLIFVTLSSTTVVHAAAYVADDIVFTKNGPVYTQPWILMRLPDLIDVYTVRFPAEGPLKVLYFRRKSL